MNKKLFIAMAVALGVSETAFADNPFSDVPAGHWAYAAVAKLAAAGIVDGYPDGNYKGIRTMTRYEMAQIIAKALAKGTIGADDKLVGEFADELDNLGVCVAKLEKNADNVKITGNIRMSYANTTGGFGGDSKSQLRSRLFFTGEVNDNWHYVAMLENNQFFEGKNESGDSDTDFQRAFLKGNIGVVNISAGRQHADYGDSDIYSMRVDSVRASVPFGDAYLKAEYGKMANIGAYGWSGAVKQGSSKAVADTFVETELGETWGNWDLAAEFIKNNNQQVMVNGDNTIWNTRANYKVGKFKVGAMYLKGDDDSLKKTKYPNADDDGYIINMGWNGAKSSKAGSWGLFAKYYNLGAPTQINPTMNGAWKKFAGEGYIGYLVGGNLTLAKNMVAQVEYYDLEGKETEKHARTLWSQLVVTF